MKACVRQEANWIDVDRHRKSRKRHCLIMKKFNFQYSIPLCPLSAPQALALRASIQQAMLGLTSAQFEKVLHPVFQV